MLKAIVRGHYDLQKLRIQTGNRIIANFRAKMNIPASETAEKAALAKIKTAFASLPKKLSKKSFSGTPIISKYAEYVLVKSYMEMLSSEHQAQKEIKALVDDTQLWISFLSAIKGVGPLMAGILLTEIDITKAATPAALWKYTGVDVAEDGKGRSMRKEHRIDREYTNKEGKKATRKSLTYNPRLKSKVLGVLAPSLIKQKSPKYYDLYKTYKTRIETEKPNVIKAHRHKMAMRYMIKKFLKHLHLHWRQMEGLPVPDKWQS